MRATERERERDRQRTLGGEYRVYRCLSALRVRKPQGQEHTGTREYKEAFIIATPIIIEMKKNAARQVKKRIRYNDTVDSLRVKHENVKEDKETGGR